MRQMFQLARIAEYTSDIRYIEGKANVMADALSRVSLPAKAATMLQSAVNAVGPQGIGFVSHFRDQSIDADTQCLVKDKHTGLCFRMVWVNDVNLICNVSSRKARPLVPEAWRCHIFDVVHGLSHQRSSLQATLSGRQPQPM